MSGKRFCKRPVEVVVDKLRLFSKISHIRRMPTDEVVTTEGLSALYGHHVDVLRVHDRIVVVAG